MSAKQKLIELYKDSPLLKGINVTEDNIIDLVFYIDENENCKSCKGLEEGKELKYTPCDYAKHEERKGNVNSIFASNYMKDANFNDFELNTEARIKAYEYANKVLKNDPDKAQGLYLVGKYGSGKTYFLSALANEFAQKGIKTIIVFMPDLSRNLKSLMGQNMLESRVNALKYVDILMLDDLGGEMMTSWLRDEIIAPIIQYRLLNNKPIYISSNLNYEALKNHFKESTTDEDGTKSNRILERIRQMTKRVIF